ncbi:DNA/RNA non-specific endonuclease [Flavobacterium sp.]|uniref:DNA/RNA non-specific endonuclease n=1 Tax=Flavobacterium sp. TaxID=239 RepID=UPI003D0E110C
MKRILLLAILSQTLTFCSREVEEPKAALSPEQFQASIYRSTIADNSHALLGDPTTSNLKDFNNYYVNKVGYTMSYCERKGIPNWVSWHLDSSWLGATDRSNDFRADASLPSSFFKVDQNMYASTGFDRGHMCPSADRTKSFALNSETFLMSNMVPQAPKNNRTTWEGLEAFLRTQVTTKGMEVFITAGGMGVGGTGTNGGITNFLANGRISVPNSTWKIALLIPKGNGDLKRIDTNAEIIAVNIPNNQNITSSWKDYITTVKQLEVDLGYKFFKNIPIAISTALKEKKYAN